MLVYHFSKIETMTASSLTISEEVTMTDAFFKRAQEMLSSAKHVHVEGTLSRQAPFVVGDFHVMANVTAPSSRSLTPVDFPLDFHFTENYAEQMPPEADDTEDVPIILIKNDLIDLQKAIEDNLLLNLPTTILTNDEKNKGVYPSGDGWQVVSQDSYEKEKTQRLNPAFASLKHFMDKKNP